MIYVAQKPGSEIHFSGNIVLERLTSYNVNLMCNAVVIVTYQKPVLPSHINQAKTK